MDARESASALQSRYEKAFHAKWARSATSDEPTVYANVPYVFTDECRRLAHEP